MEARLKLKPGQNGTKRLVEKYGDALVCVRYRYDEASRTRPIVPVETCRSALSRST